MQWIALRDREPEPDSIVVFRNCYNSYSVGPACRLGKVNTDDGLQFFACGLDYVTHWFPLPEFKEET